MIFYCLFQNATNYLNVIASRAYDYAGNVQYLNPEYDWNRTAMAVTSFEGLIITVRNDIWISADFIPCNGELIVSGANVPTPVSNMIYVYPSKPKKAKANVKIKPTVTADEASD